MSDTLPGHRYRLLEELGSGGCGVVFLALDTVSGQQVVLKRAQEGDEAQASLSEEFSRVASLSHPGIARALDFIPGKKRESSFVVFERAPGRASTELCGEAAGERILGWAAAVAEILDFLHLSGLLHGDLKPEHVFIDEEDGVRLIDFGLARAPGEPGGGTAATAAPEILLRGTGDERSDLFSLGATLFYWLFQRYPWGETLEARLSVKARRPHIPLRDDLPKGARRLLRDLLAPEAGERIGSAREIVSRLAEIGIPLPDPSLSSPATRAGSLPLVGRDEVLRQLAPGWYAGAQQPPRFLSLVGPVGSGRSRLIREIARRAKTAQRRVLQVHGSESELPLSRRLAVAIRAQASVGPCTVLFDDVDELPEETTNLLQDLPRRLAAQDSLVVVTAGSRAFGDLWQELPLEPLSAKQLREACHNLLPGPPPPAGLATRLLEASGGRPGIVIDLLAGAVRAGVIRCDATGWDLHRLEQMPLGEQDSKSAILPASLRGEQRVVALALLTASEPLGLHALSRASHVSHSRVAEAMRTLVASQLAVREASGLLRPSVRAKNLQGVADAERQRWHQRWLALTARATPEPDAVARVRWLRRLVRHATGSGRTELAARLALRAATQAVRAGRPDLASATLAELPLRETLPEVLQAHLLLASGEIHIASARPGMAAPEFKAALALFERLGRSTSASRATARLARVLGDLGQTERGLELVRSAAASTASPEVRSLALVEEGILLARQHEYTAALGQLEEALSLAPASSHVEARAHAARARCLVLIGQLDEAERELVLAREPAQATGDRSLEAALLLAEGQASLAAGHPRRLLDQVPRIREALLARGEADGLGMLSALISDAESMLGNWDRALEAALDSVRWREVHGHLGWLAVAWNRLARIHLLRGSLPATRAAARRARDLAEESRFAPALSEARAVLARILILEDKLHDARRLGDAAISSSESSEHVPARVEALIARALVCRADGESREAADLAGRALEISPVLKTNSAAEVEALALSAESLAKDDPEEAVALARRAWRVADRRGLFDAGVLALAARESALIAAGRDEEASSLRRWAAARIEEAAGRLADHVARRTFLERPDRLRLLEATGSREGQRLEALYEIVAALNSLHNSGRVAETLMDKALELLGAEQGAVVLANSEGTLEVVLCRGVEEETAADALRLSQTILERAHGGESILTLSPATDPRFHEAASVRLFGIRAVLCVPLRWKGRLVGAIYLDSRDPGHRFDRGDLRFLEALSDHAALALENARAFTRLELENDQLRADLGERDRLGEILGRSASMRELFRVIEASAPSDVPVLVTGESGTGKELVARSLHRLGRHPEGPFVPVNCAAIPEDIFESMLFGHERGAFTGAERSRPGLIAQAHSGTLFLDEIGDMPTTMQVKLLRVLEEQCVQPLGASTTRNVDIRVVTATNRDLSAATRAGAFREDLLYRIDVLRVRIPPLRERVEDIPLLAQHILAGMQSSFGPLRATPELLARLATWSWPGNVRELENTLSRLALRCEGGIIDLETLMADPDSRHCFGDSREESQTDLEKVERDAIRRALEVTSGHRVRAAGLLGIGRATLFRKIRRYGLEQVGRS